MSHLGRHAGRDGFVHLLPVTLISSLLTVSCGTSSGPPDGAGATGIGAGPGSGGSAGGAPPLGGGTGGGLGAAPSTGGTATGGDLGVGGIGGADADSSTGGVSNVIGSISDLTIEPNPNNVLSAWVSWTTPEPGSSLVQFGDDGLAWEIEGEANVASHKVLLIGMRADKTYQIRAASALTDGVVEAVGTFTTGALPAQIPTGIVSVHDPALAQPGWTLMNVQKGDGTNRAISGAPPAAVIYDEAGHPVWYFINGNTNERGGAISVDPTDKGVIMGPTLSATMGGTPFAPIEVDWAGETVWTCNDPLCGVPDQLSHHAGKLSNGNYVVMRDANTAGRISQVFLEFSPKSSTPVHEIGVEDAMTPPGSASGDWAHGNAITIDLESDVAYMSFRWLGVIKMTYSTRTLQWHLPASYGQESLSTNFGDMTFVPPESQFTDIHDPEIHDDGTILFFDNGGFTGQIQDGNPANYHSRAVEYLIDETAKTATLVWEWPGDFPVDPWYSTDLYVPFWGDADRLANGNVLIAAGRRGTVEITPESRIIEVTRDTGEVVWELRLPKDHGVYRAERLFPLPLVRPIQP